MNSDVSLDGPIQMPICPDCHSPLVWSDDDDLLRCNECQEHFNPSPWKERQ